MTLTEFLLERIAEDEGAAGNWLRFEVWDCIPENYAIRGRVLAECDAKRRIVGRESLAFGSVGQVDVKHSRTLRDLAAAYADHPDYREEWKP